MSEREMRKMCKLIVKWLNMKNTKWMRPYLFTIKKYPDCWDGVPTHMHDLKDVYEAHIKCKFVKTDDFFRRGSVHCYGDGSSRAEAIQELVEDMWRYFPNLTSDSYEELKLKLIARGEMPDE